jgi:hypothetical protein
MKHQRHFETTTSREAAQTKALIADLERIVQILDDAIYAEEELEPDDFRLRHIRSF